MDAKVQNPKCLLRAKIARTRTGDGKSMYYKKIADGLLPPHIKIGARASAAVESELDAVIAARIGGKSDAEIRQLVVALVAARKTKFQP